MQPKKKNITSFLFSLFLIVLISAPLQASAETDVETRIALQQADIQYLREQLAELRSVSDSLRKKVQELESEVAILQKNADPKIRPNADGNTDIYRGDPVSIDKTRTGVSNREALIEKTPVIPPQVASKPQAATVALSSEEQEYESARAEFEAEKYAVARKSFSEFLKKHPKSKLASNAGFWIGETYYREKNYNQAIISYRQTIEQYPEGSKVPASLLKMGMSFQLLGELQKAKVLFTTLMEEYSETPEATSAKQRLNAMPH